MQLNISMKVNINRVSGTKEYVYDFKNANYLQFDIDIRSNFKDVSKLQGNADNMTDFIW